ncbi:EAL domain-containing protein [Curvibacter sp. APW13]|uniref:bifunctional diguanylate cyclase/phosphodiesterase n=1 Tax=Curvibacter sp. APW13 TaxID=3077236 RepID=UPI0028DF876C|nr:EAL domain-containing protein [Curvibacter sp. APW13]MDT8989640.1 EAL domain-containing protein [Curvibacter sp. APW13]
MTLSQRFLKWLGTLRVSRKLMLIYLLDLTAVIYVSSILIHEKYLGIDFARKEIVGTHYIEAVRATLMTAYTSPGADLSAPLQNLAFIRKDEDDNLQAHREADAFEMALGQARQMHHEAASQSQQWQSIQALNDSASELIRTVGNQSNLILDPDLDSYYVMSLVVLRYPELLRSITSIDAYFQSPSAHPHANQTVDILRLRGGLDAAWAGIEADQIQAQRAGTPQLQGRLQPSLRYLQQSVGKLQSYLAEQAQAPTERDAAQTSQLTRAAMLALDSAWHNQLEDLEGLLHTRVSGLFARMWLHLGTALLLLIGILTLVTVVARQIATPLDHLAKVANKVRKSNDHTLRAHWDSQDEIGQLVWAFNDMLEQLDRDRLIQQELAASARAAQAQKEFVEALPVPLVVTSVPEHRVLHSNAFAQPWLNDQQLDPWRHGLEPGVRARFFQRLADQGHVDEFEARWKSPTGPMWAVLSARRLQYQGQDALLTAFTPINMLKVMEQRLELWAKVFEASNESIMIMDAGLKIVSVNRAFCRSTSYDFYEVVGESLTTLISEGDQALSTQLPELLQSQESWQGEVCLRRRSGETYPAWLMVSAVRDKQKDGAITQFIGIALDITDRKKNEERIRFLALHDVLTELPNRSLCVQRLDQALNQARQTGEQVAVLFIDLDRFKAINDTLGHHIGDGLLRSVAARLGQAVRSRDTVSRLGGDEFVVILRHVVSKDEVTALVERRLIPLIRQAHEVEGQELHVSCSVGIAVYPHDGKTIEELMRRADAAMYEAKTAGRDMARFYSPETDERALRRQAMEAQLRKALERNELHLCYQPRLQAGSLQLLSAEALLRWNNAEFGAVPPSEFIPLAEEAGLIRSIGAWVIQQACLQLQAWSLREQEGMPSPLQEVRISVNLSAAQLGDPELVPEIRAMLQDAGIRPDRLELEITESQLMDNALVAQQQISALKALGLHLSIDDFGTGYSSLAYLKRFDIDRLKVDKSFVQDMLHDSADMAIVRAVIALGHSLGLEVVAEGVENLATAQVLTALNCDELQGYHFSRPLASDAFAAWAEAPRNDIGTASTRQGQR